MKTSIIIILSLITWAPAYGAKSDPFACTLTQLIESIDGSMQARNRTQLLKKKLPTQGFGRFEEIYTDPTDPSGKKFRIEAKLERGNQGQWIIQQKLYQVLTEGELEGKDIGNRTVALEILRTTEQVHRGIPKTEYQLQCAIKPSEVTPLFADHLDMELNVDTDGVAVDISQRVHMYGIAIPYSRVFIEKNAKLDPKVFNREVDPDPKLAEKPTTVAAQLNRAALPKPAAESTWRDVWPFRFIKKQPQPRPIVLSSPVQVESAQVERAYRAQVAPSLSKATYVAVVQPVPLVLSPQSFKRISASNRQPASQSSFQGIRPSMVNGVPTIPTPLIRIWKQFGK